MEPNTLKFTRRAFGRLGLSLLPGAAAQGQRSDQDAQFARDVVRSYELQITALDMEDVRQVLRAMQAPVLGCGVATGSGRALRAATVALRCVGGAARYSLIVTAVAPGDVVLRESKQVYETIRGRAPLYSTLIYATFDDKALAPRSLRVSLLTG